MDLGFCNLSLAPVRLEATEQSAMITQLLFGDIFQIIDSQKNYFKIKCMYDNSTGWIDQQQCILLSTSEYSKFLNNPTETTIDLVQLLILNSKDMLPIVLGSSIPRLTDNIFHINGIEYYFEGQSKTNKITSTPDSIIEQAYMYLNAPFLSGGRSPFGIDAAGFTQMTYKLNGITLPREAIQQSTLGNPIYLISDAKSGDLLFFENEQKKITHVGIYIDGGKIIHACGKVKIDKVDHQGIFDINNNSYSHILRLIKRII